LTKVSVPPISIPVPLLAGSAVSSTHLRGYFTAGSFTGILSECWIPGRSDETLIKKN